MNRPTQRQRAGWRRLPVRSTEWLAVLMALLFALPTTGFAARKRGSADKGKVKASGDVQRFGKDRRARGKAGKASKAGEKAGEGEADVADVPEDEQDGVPRSMAARRARQRSNVEDIDDEIDILRELLDIERGSPTEADTLLELSYVLWDRAEAYELEGYDTRYTVGIANAKKEGNKALARRLEIEQQNLLDQARATKSEVIDSLKRIERRFARFSKLDEVLYALGFHLGELERHGEAVDAYMRMVRKVPDSPYIPDAYLGIGNYYFGKNQGGEALKWYAKVKRFPKSNAYGWALYYESWVYYNRQEYRQAAKGFVATLDYSAEVERDGSGRVTFTEDGAKYLVRAWSEYSDPKTAVKYFEQVTPGRVDKMLELVSAYYVSVSAYAKSNIILEELIERHRDDKRVVRYHYAHVENNYRIPDLAGTVASVERLSEALIKFGDAAPMREEIPTLLAEIGSTLHFEADKTLDRTVLGYAEKIYRAYLTFYPKHKFVYDLSYQHALALYQLERWTDAAAGYEKVIAMDPTGKHAEPAAHRALISYLKLQNLDAETGEKDADKILTAKPLDEDTQRVADACDRYIKIARANNKGDDEDLAKALFVLARLYYQHNQFEKAGELFATFVQDYLDAKLHKETGDKLSVDGARLMLSAYNLGQDGKNLIKWTNILIKDDRFNQGRLGEILIAIKENEDYNRCLELKDKPVEAAKCLLKYASEYPTSNQAQRAYAGAAQFYRRALLRDEVIDTYRKLAKAYPEDDRAAEALYEVGEVYREVANFSAAADAYEEMALKYPKHSLAKSALQRAALVRDGLGQYDKVIENAERALKAKSADPESAKETSEVAYKLSIQYVNKEDWRGVIRASDSFLKRGSDAPLNLRLAAQANAAQAWMNIRGGDRKAKAYLDQIVETARKLTEEGKFNELPREGKNAVAQALFLLGEIHFNQMLKLRGRTRRLEDAVKYATDKAKLAAQADAFYVEVENSKNGKWIAAAASRRGRAQHEIAKSLEKLPPPPSFKRVAELREEWATKMVEKAEPYKQKAMELYRAALKRAASLFAFDTYWEQARDNLKELDTEFAQMASMPEFTVELSAVEWKGSDKPKAAIERIREQLFGRTRKELQVDTGGADAAAGQAQVGALFLELATAHHVLGQHREAIMVGNAAIFVVPELEKDVELLRVLGMSYIAINSIRQGLVYLQRAANADPQATRPLLDIVSLQIKRLDLETAAELLREVLKRDPNHYWARVTLPVALRRLGKKDEAIEMLDKLVAEQPKAEAHYNRCVIFQAVLNKGKAEVTRAMEACNAAAEAAEPRSKQQDELKKRAQGLKDQLEFMQ
jgi:tetratricopeptide (TPR) repeat protein